MHVYLQMNGSTLLIMSCYNLDHYRATSCHIKAQMYKAIGVFFLQIFML